MTDISIIREVEIFECPVCQGDGVIEEENGWCFYVSCLDCGAHTAEVAYAAPEERLDAAKKAAALWNRGKVLSPSPGE